jgi:transposase
MARTEEGLSAKPHLGPPPRLSDRQALQLEQMLRQGAHRHGWPNARWTVARVTELIQRHFGLHYHPEHVRKILKYRLNPIGENPEINAGRPARRARRARAAAVLCGV